MTLHCLRRSLPLALFSLLLALSAFGQEQPPYQNSSLPLEQRVNDLLARMTLEEKVSQMQNHAAAIPRLGIPEYNWWNEGLHGVARAGVATVFPQAIGMAATWDANLLRQEGETVANEARAKYNQAQREGNHEIYFGLTIWSPNINIFRDPRWGRGQETLGEDPFLASRLGVAFVKALQGDDPARLKTVATPKHLAVHSGPEATRHGFRVDPTPHDLEDTYLPAFRATVQEGHAASIMCAYNAIGKEPACANDWLLNQVVRKQWGFPGAVVSDCDAIRDIYKAHKFASDAEHAAVVSVRGGTDLSCGTEYRELAAAVKDKLIAESDIDIALRRLLTLRFRLGMFDQGGPYADIPFSEIDSPAHRALALQAAHESMVLLKNDGVLPLRDISRLAVIGPNAANLRTLLGNYHGVPASPLLPVDAFEKEAAAMPEVSRPKILYAQGSPLVSSLPLPAPRTLFQNPRQPNTAGLRGEYFDNPNWGGKPAYTTNDPQIDFDWDAARPHNRPEVSRDAFSVRWSGTITVPEPGRYTFSTSFPHCFPCYDTEYYRIYLDGEKIAEESVAGGERRPEAGKPFEIDIADTFPHNFRVEYSHKSPLFGGGITLNWTPPSEVLRTEAVEAVNRSQVAIVFLGLSPGLEGEEMKVDAPGFKKGDHTDLQLPPVQQQLLEALAATRKPLIIILLNGSPLAVNWAQQHAAAILEAWYPGEAGGEAIVDTLWGRNNPAGRLPVTFYRSVEQLPAFDDYSMARRTYRYFHGKPLYGFGFGLSYSTFAYENLRLSNQSVKPGNSLTVEADIRNTSKIEGDEVVELYLTHPRIAGAPRHTLQGFTRLHLKPGETQQVRFELSEKQLSLVESDGTRKVEEGEYTVSVGGAQPEEATTGVEGKFRVNGATQ